ncbi:hypothetical protein GCM10010252_04830 [Streptomyces aureoverticillatus]|nr:hypothetical protein GCM10010252_04830 [Streptomyces aureoverticillatus]
MRTRKALATALGLAAAAVVTPLVTAPPAAAAQWWSYQMHTDDGDPGGRVRYQPNGDRVQVCDIEADGHRAGVHVYDTVLRAHVDDFAVGTAGKCVTHDANDTNLKEGRKYVFTVYLEQGGRVSYTDKSTWKG